MAADGLGVMVRDSGHVIALDTAAMATAATRAPASPQGTHPTRAGRQSRCRTTPPLRDESAVVVESPTPSIDSTVIDLSAYERAAQKRTIQ